MLFVTFWSSRGDGVIHTLFFSIPSVFMRASLVDFCSEKNLQPDALAAAALAPQLYWTHGSTTSVT